MRRNYVKDKAIENISGEARRIYQEATPEEREELFIDCMVQFNLKKEMNSIYRNAQFGKSSEQLQLPLFDKDNVPTDFANSREIDQKILELKQQRVADLESAKEINQEQLDAARRSLQKAEEEIARSQSSEKKSEKPKKAKKSSPKMPPVTRIDTEEVFSLNGESCPVCGAQLRSAGFKTRRKIRYIPGHLEVVEEKFETGVCPHKCTNNGAAVIITRKPDEPDLIDGSPATSSLIAGLGVNKFVQGIPLYRMEKEFSRRDTSLSRQTMSNMMIYCYQTMIRPLQEKMLLDLRKQNVIMMDETPLTCLELGKKGSMVVGLSGKYEQKQMTVYKFYETREQSFVCDFLGDDYRGALMSDGNPAYANYLPPVHLNCLAHARRKLHEAIVSRTDYIHEYRKLSPSEQKLFLEENPALNILMSAMSCIQDLYRIEHFCGDDPDELAQARAVLSYDVFIRLRVLMEEIKNGFEEQTAAWKAGNYFVERETQLERYLEEPEYPIDNNLCEQAVKTFVIDRKNFLFSKSAEGAKAAAGYMTMVTSAIQNGLDPYRYLMYVLDRLKYYKVRKPTEDHYCEPIPEDVFEEIVPYSDKLPEELRVRKTVSEK